MLSTLELNYIQHLQRGYCENHPDVIAGTKQQVVDRAVKQLLTALQSNGFELDGNILKRGNGWLQYDAETSKWQYSNNAGVAWVDFSAGGYIIGEIRMFSIAVPSGWLLCNGQLVSRSSALGILYTALSFPYGAGDGTTTCNVPDLNEFFVMGSGTNNLGDSGGSNAVTLTTDHLPNAALNVLVDYDTEAGSGNCFVRGAASKGTLNFPTANMGTGKAHENIPAYLVLNFAVYTGE